MPKAFSIDILIRWADVDANRHVRHSAYFDFAATARILFFSSHGVTTERLEALRLGPILFREEAVYRRELRLEDKILVDAEVTKARRDYSRWSIRHTLYKVDDRVAAVINVDGAWIDLDRRKLTAPGPEVHGVFDGISRAADFQFID